MNKSVVLQLYYANTKVCFNNSSEKSPLTLPTLVHAADITTRKWHSFDPAQD